MILVQASYAFARRGETKCLTKGGGGFENYVLKGKISLLYYTSSDYGYGIAAKKRNASASKFIFAIDIPLPPQPKKKIT